MKLRKKVFVSLFLLPIIISCNTNDDVKNELRTMFAGQVDLSMIDSMIQKNSFDSEANYKIVNYFDSSECIPCRMRELEAWHGFADSLKRRNVETLFVFSPYSDDYDIFHFIRTNRTNKIAIAIDTLSVFKQKNPQIPNNHLFHTFLLDKRNNVLLVGNPIENERIRSKLFEKIVHCE